MERWKQRAHTLTLTHAHDHDPDSAENVGLFLHPFFSDVRRERSNIVQFLPIAKSFDGFDLQLGKANMRVLFFSPSPQPLNFEHIHCFGLCDRLTYMQGICIPEQMCVDVCSQRKHGQPLSHLQRIFILLHQRVLGQLHLLQLLD